MTNPPQPDNYEPIPTINLGRANSPTILVPDPTQTNTAPRINRSSERIIKDDGNGISVVEITEGQERKVEKRYLRSAGIQVVMAGENEMVYSYALGSLKHNIIPSRSRRTETHIIVTTPHVGQPYKYPSILNRPLDGVSQKEKDEYYRTERKRETEIIHMGMNLAVAAEYAHGKGLSHNDIKPDNLWQSDHDGTVLVGDLGSVCESGERKQSFTPRYAPADLVTRNFIAHPTDDLFAIASMMYEAKFGRTVNEELVNLLGLDANIVDSYQLLIDINSHPGLQNAYQAVFEKIETEVQSPLLAIALRQAINPSFNVRQTLTATNMLDELKRASPETVIFTKVDPAIWNKIRKGSETELMTLVEQIKLSLKSVEYKTPWREALEKCSKLYSYASGNGILDRGTDRDRGETWEGTFIRILREQLKTGKINPFFFDPEEGFSYSSKTALVEPSEEILEALRVFVKLADLADNVHADEIKGDINKRDGHRRSVLVGYSSY